MSMLSLPESALSLGSKIGRYFGIVSMVPSAFLVLWTYALVASGAWDGRPDLGALTKHLGTFSISEAAWLLIATLLVALFLHPLLFGSTRLLEGYWGTSRLAVALASVRILHHRKRWARLKQLDDRASLALKAHTEGAAQPRQR